MAEKHGSRFKDKVCIITASSTGIGYAIAKRMIEEGGHVCISSRKQQNVDKAVQELKAFTTHPGQQVFGVVCHVGKEEHRQRMVQKCVEKFGHIDVFVSNAAINPQATNILNTDPGVWDKLFDVNVKCTYLLARLIVPHMTRPGANIVIISSIAGYNPSEMLAAYGVTKTSLLGLTKALSTELAHDNIRVNAIAPGIIKTKFSSMLWENDGVEKELCRTIPLGRLGKVENISGVAAFLASQDGDFITGECIVAAGGVHCRL